MQLSRLSTPRLAGAAIIAAMGVQALTPNSVLRGDVTLFASHAATMLEGSLPYFDSALEHLPLSILPILVAGLMEKAGLPYDVAFVAMSAIALVLITRTIDQAGRVTDAGAAGPRWVLVAAPLFPVVLYRMDPWSTLFASLAFLAVVKGEDRRYLGWAAIGIATKGWPVVFAARDWVRGHRHRALVMLGATATLAIALLMTPGFRSGRSFTGVHLETVTGSLTLLARLAAGQPHGIESAAGALYISAGLWALIGNAMLGLLIWAVAYRRRNGRSDAWLIAATISGLLLASPLLSAQFLLWLTPFVALLPRPRLHWLLAAAGAASTILLVWWSPTDTAWASLLAARNLTLVAGAIALVATPSLSSATAP